NMPYALKTAGGDVTTGAIDFEPNVIADRELITGQNPRSDHAIAAKLIEALADQKRRAAQREIRRGTVRPVHLAIEANASALHRLVPRPQPAGSSHVVPKS